MRITRFSSALSTSGRIEPSDLDHVAAEGFRSILCNLPDEESTDRPFATIAEKAAAIGLDTRHVPVGTGPADASVIGAFRSAMADMPKPILAYCATGTRSLRLAEAVAAAERDLRHQVVIVGGGAAGMAVAASLQARDRRLDVVVVEPARMHAYQPGWTMVGAGVFAPETTRRPTVSVLPKGARIIEGAVTMVDGGTRRITLADGRTIAYERLVLSPGLELAWDAIEGLEATLGKNGVTSNYRYDLAPYTWRLVQDLREGKALFTQPPMPIKCAGAPQKAMYLSCDTWRRDGRLAAIDVAFMTAAPVLFGVPEYVPALMDTVTSYGIAPFYRHDLIRVDGAAKIAWFKSLTDGSVVERPFDMLHVVPPQRPPAFLKASGLADDAGWLDVDHATLRHRAFPEIYGAGDATCTPNAKTAAAARKQAPVVAENLLRDMKRSKQPTDAVYDGYGSCPLTVERGRIVLAEFAYGGRRVPSFPKWLLDDTRPSRLAWHLKARVLPLVYWHAMLKGREWLASPRRAR